MKLVPVVVGIALVLIAIVLGPIYGAATVNYVASGSPSIGMPGTWGQSPASPTLVPATALGLVLIVNNIPQSTISSCDIQVNTVSSSGTSTSTVVPMTPMTYGPENPYNSSAIYYSYGVTLNAGVEYELLFSVQGQNSYTAAYFIEGAALTGYFTINGQQVDETSVITVTDPTLTFTCVASSPIFIASSAVNPVVTISQGGTVLATLLGAPVGASLSFTFASYTLPAYGSYTVNGTITYGGQTVDYMSVLAAFPAPSASAADVAYVQWALGLVGAALIMVGLVVPAKRSGR